MYRSILVVIMVGMALCLVMLMGYRAQLLYGWMRLARSRADMGVALTLVGDGMAHLSSVDIPSSVLPRHWSEMGTGGVVLDFPHGSVRYYRESSRVLVVGITPNRALSALSVMVTVSGNRVLQANQKTWWVE